MNMPLSEIQNTFNAMNNKKICPVCGKKFADEYIEEKIGNRFFAHVYNDNGEGINKIQKWCELKKVK